MKTALIILYLCSIMQGQELSSTGQMVGSTVIKPDAFFQKIHDAGYNFSSTSHPVIIVDKDTVYTDENYFSVLIKHELKKSLIDYEAECFADSSRNGGYVRYEGETTVDYAENEFALIGLLKGIKEFTNLKPIVTRIYSHKSPTFEGFINFMRGK